MPKSIRWLILVLIAFLLGVIVTSFVLSSLQFLNANLNVYLNSVGTAVILAVVAVVGLVVALGLRTSPPVAVVASMVSVAASLGMFTFLLASALFFFGNQARQPVTGAGTLAIALIFFGIGVISSRQVAEKVKVWMELGREET